MSTSDLEHRLSTEAHLEEPPAALRRDILRHVHDHPRARSSRSCPAPPRTWARAAAAVLMTAAAVTAMTTVARRPAPAPKRAETVTLPAFLRTPSRVSIPITAPLDAEHEAMREDFRNATAFATQRIPLVAQVRNHVRRRFAES